MENLAVTRCARAIGRTGGRGRRGLALVAVALLLVVVQMIVLGVLGGAGRDAQLAAERAQSARARMNAESGAVLMMREWLDTPALPATGTITLPAGSAVIVTPYAASPSAPGSGVIEGRTTQARRSMSITLN